MGLVKSTNTRPEIAVRSLLHRLGFRFRIRKKGLPGKPDIVLARWKVVILVHGCFWHRHRGCANTRTPKTRVEFWKRKFDGNVKRDKEVRRKLKALGWRVIVVWECEISDQATLARRFQEIIRESTQIS